VGIEKPNGCWIGRRTYLAVGVGCADDLVGARAVWVRPRRAAQPAV
jgi:hypothetical protein